MKQLNYILKRILQMIPVLFAVTIIIFWGIRLIPGNPALTVLGEKASQSAIEAMGKKDGVGLTNLETVFVLLTRSGSSGLW